MNELLWDTLLEKQRHLEENSLTRGAERFRKKIETANASGKASTVGAARKLLQHAIEPLQKGIEHLIEEQKTKRGPKHFAVKWCEALGPETAAYMTVKTVLDGLAKHTPLRVAALDISELILDELRWRRFEEKAPGLFKYRMSKFNTSSYTHMARSLNAAMRYAEIEVGDLDMPMNARLLVGTKLIDLLVQTTGLVEVVSHRTTTTKRRRPVFKDELYVTATAETMRWLQARNQAMEFLSPVCLPMVVPPLPWSREDRGGYRFAMRGKYALVRGLTKEHQARVQEAEMPTVYAAVNNIQNTAWRINPAVLELVEQIRNSGREFAGVPAFEEEPLPPKPHDIAENEEARKEWRKDAHRVRESNHRRAIRALEFTKVMAAAEAVKDLPAIYFPYNLDFRGRVYPIADYLSPQGDDLCRALLTFAEGKPLGEHGIVWLAIHGANSMGEYRGAKMSKMTFQERVDWVVAHSQEICNVAKDPLADLWWGDAEDPLQFYAFCVEWNGFIAAHARGAGSEYQCSLPVAQDGSCNGLQHFSAMFRDSVGGRAVNLLPSDKPQDIYQSNADNVLDQLERLAGSDELAVKWLTSGLVTRKLCKRPTMTFGYGSKKFGFRNQLLEELQGRKNWPEIKRLFADASGQSDVGNACNLMSGLIWNALGETVVAAFEAMEWMQKAVRAVVRSGKPIEWTVRATGFPVRQEYFISNRTQIKTVLAGRVVQPSVYTQTQEIERHKQVNAIAPNFVHSMDAAALMLAVQQASADGIESFGMIHDSYATVPADCGVMAKATRQAFVRLYVGQDVPATLHADLCAQAQANGINPEDVPLPPAMGDLDVAVVLVSDYFFA